jgi:hypothetical protein
MRRAALHFEEPDMSWMRADDAARRRSCPSRLEPDATTSESSTSTTVKRCTRVSFECHTDLLMEDLFEDLEENDSELELEQMELEFFKLLGLYGSLQ